jgi:hypothetical protein
MTAHADSSVPETSDHATGEATPASVEPGYDPFAVALAALNGETSASGDSSADAISGIERLAADGFHREGDASVTSASLADGKVSTFRIGAGGFDKVTVTGDGGLWVGATAVDTHVVEITANGRIKAGTYTLIDYEGAIGGAGFAGLSLRHDPRLHVELVNNTAESKIEVVVAGTDAMELASAVKNIWSSVTRSEWSLLPRLLPRPAQQVQ